MTAMTLSPERVRKFTETAVKEYETSSIVKIGNFLWRSAEPGEKGDFVRIGRNFLSDGKPFVDYYSRGNEYFSPEIFGLGRSVAIGEEKYLIAQLERFFRPLECPSIIRMLSDLRNVTEPKLSVALMPLDYYHDFMEGFLLRQNAVCVMEDPHHISLGSHRMRVVWSNKYVKFRQFTFLADDAIEWIINPDPVSQSWLRVSVKPAKMKKFEVNVETIALCKLHNMTHGFAFDVKERPAVPFKWPQQ